jgi:hypothetical protein
MHFLKYLVGVATGYEQDGLGSITGRGKIFLLSIVARLVWLWAHTAYPIGTEGSFPGR